MILGKSSFVRDTNPKILKFIPIYIYVLVLLGFTEFQGFGRFFLDFLVYTSCQLPGKKNQLSF